MKLKHLLTALLLLNTCMAFAQTDSTKKNSRQVLMDSVCAYANRQDTSLINTKEDLQKMLMQCIMQRMDLMLEAMNEAHVDLNDPNAPKEFGEKLGMEMVMKCPTLMQASVKIAMKEMDKPEPAKKTPSNTKPSKAPASKPKATVKPKG
ncbi:MAG: hypothetical protein EKK37_12240 [Sphingobacteriales bacterium]|nr:MAG: hypothetical protein EKK37_12240 [Sphingobacteriales bacterium]